MQGRYTQIPHKAKTPPMQHYSPLREDLHTIIKRTSSKFQQSDNNSQRANRRSKIPDVVFNYIGQQTRQQNSIKKSSIKLSKKSSNRQSQSIYPGDIFEQEQENYVPSNHIRKSMALKMNLSGLRNSKDREAKCDICLLQISNKQFMAFSQQCKHKYCRSCLHQYVIYKIQMFEKVQCPNQQCKAELSQNCQIYKQLPLDTRQKFKKLRQYQNVINKQNVRLCPHQACNGQIYVGDGSFDPKCDTCHLTFCKKCNFKMHSGDCEPFQLDFFQNTLQYRQCSKCKNVIQKSQGCNHMTCRCGYQFCYICGAKWKSTHTCQNLNGQPYVQQTCECCCCECQECDICQNIDFCCQCECFDWQCCHITPIRWFFKIVLILLVFALGIPIYIAYIILTVLMHFFMGILFGCCVMPCELLQQTESSCLIFLAVIFFPITILVSIGRGLKAVFQEELVQQLGGFIAAPCQIMTQICQI